MLVEIICDNDMVKVGWFGQNEKYLHKGSVGESLLVIPAPWLYNITQIEQELLSHRWPRYISTL
jgi:hypothetical protein